MTFNLDNLNEILGPNRFPHRSVLKMRLIKAGISRDQIDMRVSGVKFYSVGNREDLPELKKTYDLIAALRIDFMFDVMIVWEGGMISVEFINIIYVPREKL